ncbi:hypothetical protein SVIO_028850 [Streptomyces violaceusniger]|uniref:Uncharacterized protein n=1 Tax=Streptomyces violaceusniger TaxID=68280 RepID=A0A4D4KU86_STRVO|nr:hypothetical protein SVIO_028850 [Streptomyces violaceusniger]
MRENGSHPDRAGDSAPLATCMVPGKGRGGPLRMEFRVELAAGKLGEEIAKVQTAVFRDVLLHLSAPRVEE